MSKEKENAVVPANDAQMSLDEMLVANGLGEFRVGKGEIAEGLEAMDASDIKLPKIKIAQATSQEVADAKARPGQLYNPVTDKAFDSLTVSFLVLGKRRTMWPATFKRGDNPLCYSTDGITGQTVDGTRRPCLNCPYQDWNKMSADAKHPPCMQGYVWLGVTLGESGEEPAPFRLIASGKSVGITKNFLNVLAMKRVHLCVFNVKLSTVKESNDSGTYYVLKYDVVGAARDAAEARERMDMGRALSDLFRQTMETDATSVEMAAMDEDGYGDDVAESGVAGKDKF